MVQYERVITINTSIKMSIEVELNCLESTHFDGITARNYWILFSQLANQRRDKMTAPLAFIYL